MKLTYAIYKLIFNNLKIYIKPLDFKADFTILEKRLSTDPNLKDVQN